MFFRVIEGTKLKLKITRPRKEKKLPRVIESEFLKTRIKSIRNKKHKAILWLAFSTGMRVSEVINLNIKDLDNRRMLITIVNGKGKKDRIVPLSVGTLEVLREYVKEHKPYLKMFNGQNNLLYSASSCNKLVKKYIGEEYSFHSLRHAAFTYMLDNGTDISIIQKLAGHKSHKTTSIYTHLTTKTINQAQLAL